MDSIKTERLVFVYNANSGIGNALLDSAHKILSPNSYDCNLCAITFGVFSENKKWKDFRQNSGFEMKFLHLDEFKELYPSEHHNNNNAFPRAFILKEGILEEFLHKREINAMDNQEDLIVAVQEKLGQINFEEKGKYT